MPVKVNIKETNLQPLNALTKRSTTDMIVIHHTGERDIDASAVQIDQWHKEKDYSMIGYHFVIRKNGAIERGRPEWFVGAHAYGENYHTLGVHLSGDFMTAKPTSQQIEMSAMLLAYLSEKYNIPLDRNHIVGHGELMSTDCPGKNLQNELPIIVGKANWYRYGPPKSDTVAKEIVTIRSTTAISEANKTKIKSILDYADVQFEAG